MIRPFLHILCFFLSFTAATTAFAGTLTLDTGWTFRLSPQDANIGPHPEAVAWMPATVAGTVQTDLMALGKLADPWKSDNEGLAQWVGLSDWEYRTDFTVTADALADDRAEMVFDGLDTFAEVRLNGTLILNADNMFRTWRVDVKPYLKAGANRLEITFYSPIKKLQPDILKRPYVLPGSYDSMFGDEPKGKQTASYVRKAGYHYSWDFAPRLVTMGVWKPVRLETWNTARLVDLHLAQTHLDKQMAALDARIEIESERPGTQELTLDIAGPDGKISTSKQTVELHSGLNRLTLPVRIKDPKWWWPVGYGHPDLYTVTLKASDVGTMTRRIGLRTTELRRKKDQWGRSLEVVINGVPIFAKGANLEPIDSFAHRVKPAQIDQVLTSAVEGNMNLLRVWGGGYYPDDYLYDRADELGLMLWQDFMFGGALTPNDADYRENVRREAIDQVRRLRNHPSIVAYIGNNEVQQSWEKWPDRKAFRDTITADERESVATGILRVFDTVLRMAVAEHAPGTPYAPGSPSADYDGPADQMDDGDVHYWSVWGSLPIEDYMSVTPRFMSEFGLHSMPVMASVKQMLAPKPVPSTHVLTNAFDSGKGNGRMMGYIRTSYGEPRSFESYVYLSQLMQAEGIELAASHLRANRPRSMGALYWTLNDVWPGMIDSKWPGAAWGSVDYYGRWKAVHYRAKRFYAPLGVAFQRYKGVTKAHIVSDLMTPKTVNWRLTVRDFNGQILSERTGRTEVAALSSPQIGLFADADLLGGADRRTTQAVFEISDETGVIQKAHVYFETAKAMNWADPKIASTFKRAPGGYDLTLSTKAAARGVWVDVGTVEARLSDNAFDMAARETVTVRVTTKADLKTLKSALKIQSYYGTAER